jgi:hypothetical protein
MFVCADTFTVNEEFTIGVVGVKRCHFQVYTKDMERVDVFIPPGLLCICFADARASKSLLYLALHSSKMMS